METGLTPTERTTRGATRPLRVPRVVAFFNPISKRLLGAGLPLGPNALITIRGRQSGLRRTTPLAIIEFGGRRWVWSPWGDVHWVRNLRAAGGATITIHGKTEDVSATELDAAERVAFFRDVLGPVARRMRFGVLFTRIGEGVALNPPVEEAADRGVFELPPVGCPAGQAAPSQRRTSGSCSSRWPPK